MEPFWFDLSTRTCRIRWIPRFRQTDREPFPLRRPMNDSSPRTLFRRSLIALAVGSILIAACYAFVDRPVATLVHRDGFRREVVLKWFTYPPPIVQLWTPALLAVLGVRWSLGRLRRWEMALLLASVSLVLADQFRETLALVFGRYWPETWIDDNPSFIGDGAYGFHPFHSGSAYESFPSGHTARTLAVVSTYWILYPRWRAVGVAGTLAVVVGLIGMNYHFVSDVLAGGLIGALVGSYGVAMSGIEKRQDP
jgi:membrane-associated phospholipid phosphatase